MHFYIRSLGGGQEIAKTNGVKFVRRQSFARIADKWDVRNVDHNLNDRWCRRRGCADLAQRKFKKRTNI